MYLWKLLFDSTIAKLMWYLPCLWSVVTSHLSNTITSSNCCVSSTTRLLLFPQIACLAALAVLWGCLGLPSVYRPFISQLRSIAHTKQYHLFILQLITLCEIDAFPIFFAYADSIYIVYCMWDQPYISLFHIDFRLFLSCVHIHIHIQQS